jgi:hypothetical protein
LELPKIEEKETFEDEHSIDYVRLIRLEIVQKYKETYPEVANLDQYVTVSEARESEQLELDLPLPTVEFPQQDFIILQVIPQTPTQHGKVYVR